jgi:lipoprotein-anchoring transpeptidase ErfK/SrfK
VTATRLQRAALFTSLALLSAGTLTACDQATGVDGPGGSQAEPEPIPVEFTANVGKREEVPVDRVVRLKASKGRITEASLRVANGQGRVPGEIVREGAAWRAGELLESGTTYRLTAVAESDEGETQRFARTFSTDDLTLDEQTYPSFVPVDGETVGVGMPVILKFDLPVKNKAAFERRLSVKTSPVQKGSWHWLSDNEVHWRPKVYWKPGTEVTVRADVNSVHAGDGIYGQEDRVARFRIGDKVVMRAHVPSYSMKVFRNGQLLRTIPISAGKDGFTTRSGTKVITEKHRYKDMTSASIGIADEDDADFYDLENVEYAMRVTFTGEFIHAAPWSVGSQGSANVSHGCVGMSTDNAGWLYGVTKVGDIVEVTGTDRYMEMGNGYADWNLSWADYQKGSALS